MEPPPITRQSWADISEEPLHQIPFFVPAPCSVFEQVMGAPPPPPDDWVTPKRVVRLKELPLPPNSVPGDVAPDIIFRLGIVDGPFAMIGGIIAGIVYLGYRIDKSVHEQTREALAARSG